MKLLLASASLDDARWAAAAGLVDGVYTTPFTLLEAAPRLREQVVALAQITGAPVHVSVHAVAGPDAYHQAREIARVHDQIVVHLPLTEDVIGTMRRLRTDGVRVAASFVITPAQALLAARAGATAVVTPLPAAAAAGHHAGDLLRDIRRALDAARAECDLIAEGSATGVDLATAVVAGADGVTASRGLLREALVHPSTDRCLDAYLGDIARRPYQWAPE